MDNTLFLLIFFFNVQTAHFWKCTKGKIIFSSKAPLEMINAKSPDLKGVIDPTNGTFAFSVQNKTFRGFNSTLQEEHFHESYMESHKYKQSGFMGKIIEKIDFTKNGTTTIRAKGKLTIHGMERERIIQSIVEINGQQMSIKCTFSVPLAEHNISIPKIVNQKPPPIGSFASSWNSNQRQKYSILWTVLRQPLITWLQTRSPIYCSWIFI
jgi:hypothetical protein